MPLTQSKPPSHSYELAPVHNTKIESTEPTLTQKPPVTEESAHHGIFSQHRWGLEILSGRDEGYLPLDNDITECTLSYVAYKYTDARANGSVFSFGNIHVVDLEWAARSQSPQIPRLVSSPVKAGIPDLYFDGVDERALKDLLQPPTFQLEFVEGD
ncbi:hypothetical protein FVEN_g2863 [Fusarium venenatum]|nr:hypothetical protein FVEN_g2863 [Fusarium venenatum]